MQSSSVAEESSPQEVEVQKQAMPNSASGIEMGLLTGCQDRPYAFGLAMALIAKGVSLDIIGGDEIDSPELHTTPQLRFLNFRGSQTTNVSFAKKLSKLLVYYAKLIRYRSEEHTSELQSLRHLV